MATDDPPSRFPLELTPIPVVIEGLTPEQADLAICRSTCEQRGLALAALQAKCDEQERLIQQLHADRRALAAEVKRLRSK